VLGNEGVELCEDCFILALDVKECDHLSAEKQETDVSGEESLEVIVGLAWGLFGDVGDGLADLFAEDVLELLLLLHLFAEGFGLFEAVHLHIDTQNEFLEDLFVFDLLEEPQWGLSAGVVGYA
jgi:hypothetical protein